MDNELLNDSLPPQNIEAEQAVLGAVFLSPDALADAMEFVEAKDFYRRAHQLLFQAMIDLNDDGEAIDVLTVNNRLEMNNQLDDVGGVAYIAELASSVPTAACNWLTFINIFNSGLQAVPFSRAACFLSCLFWLW